MPIVFYRCTRCNATVESRSQKVPSVCDECGEQGSLEKQFSIPQGYTFKKKDQDLK